MPPTPPRAADSYYGIGLSAEQEIEKRETITSRDSHGAGVGHLTKNDDIKDCKSNNLNTAIGPWNLRRLSSSLDYYVNYNKNLLYTVDLENADEVIDYYFEDNNNNDNDDDYIENFNNYKKIGSNSKSGSIFDYESAVKTPRQFRALSRLTLTQTLRNWKINLTCVVIVPLIMLIIMQSIILVITRTSNGNDNSNRQKIVFCSNSAQFMDTTWGNIPRLTRTKDELDKEKNPIIYDVVRPSILKDPFVNLDTSQVQAPHECANVFMGKSNNYTVESPYFIDSGANGVSHIYLDTTYLPKPKGGWKYFNDQSIFPINDTILYNISAQTLPWGYLVTDQGVQDIDSTLYDNPADTTLITLLNQTTIFYTRKENSNFLKGIPDQFFQLPIDNSPQLASLKDFLSTFFSGDASTYYVDTGIFIRSPHALAEGALVANINKTFENFKTMILTNTSFSLDQTTLPPPHGILYFDNIDEKQSQMSYTLQYGNIPIALQLLATELPYVLNITDKNSTELTIDTFIQLFSKYPSAGFRRLIAVNQLSNALGAGKLEIVHKLRAMPRQFSVTENDRDNSAIVGSAFYTYNIIFDGSSPPRIWYIHPSFAFYEGIRRITDTASLINNLRPYELFSLQADDELFVIMTVLISEAFLMIILSLYFQLVLPSEYGIQKGYFFFITEPFKKYILNQKNNDTNIHDPTQTIMLAQALGETMGDDDVKAERLRVLSGNYPVESTNLVVKELVKVYPDGKLAVDNLTFAVEKNVVFGLLGPNGAGKTSTMHILTGLYPLTSGSVYIDGTDIRSDVEKIYTKIGVCPQFDLLWPDLTIEEHLLFYARLRGVDPRLETEAINHTLKLVELTEFKYRLVRGLSGGEKRRLSIAIALTGDSKVVFLDEPTTGLDPDVRRTIWSIIANAKQGKTIILTTHSMEEADALCDRLGIMAAGHLRCLGSPLHLKQKHGTGYQISFNVVATASLDHACDQIIALLPYPHNQIEKFDTMATYQFGAQQGTLATLFKEIEQNKVNWGIQDYSITQSSLEDVFLRVVKAAEERSFFE
ncbi:3807_t:CDS:10 [Ambispora leptoticha]|uniref:3807_t:CDS:1 n=1 Tax=Ambispora leptoticha TaxID=144679 RepID=A0A9N8WK27_9GLOM|nr:3807_t:CDS:10 [Ambispora leptoticha]